VGRGGPGIPNRRYECKFKTNRPHEDEIGYYTIFKHTLRKLSIKIRDPSRHPIRIHLDRSATTYAQIQQRISGFLHTLINIFKYPSQPDPFLTSPFLISLLTSRDHLKKLHLHCGSTSSLSLSAFPLSYPGPTGLTRPQNHITNQSDVKQPYRTHKRLTEHK